MKRHTWPSHRGRECSSRIQKEVTQAQVLQCVLQPALSTGLQTLLVSLTHHTQEQGTDAEVCHREGKACYEPVYNTTWTHFLLKRNPCPSQWGLWEQDVALTTTAGCVGTNDWDRVQGEGI